MGPRTKCDQIIYEAIAKAAEIIVRGRCQVPPTSTGAANGSNNATPATTYSNNTNSNIGTGSPRSHGTGVGGSATSAGSGGSSVKFHLEVDQVDSVRSILQMWKKSLHIPLRLDVYYQYCTDTNQPEQTTRKELLERWCIDYLPNEQLNQQLNQQQPLSSSIKPNTNKSSHPSNHADETIAQLHLVCKHLVIFLRTLYSFTRIMPAYRLHRALLLDDDEIKHEDGTMPVPGGGAAYSNNAAANLGGGGGYYQTQHQHPPNRDLHLLGGKILYSFYVSDKPQHSQPQPQSSSTTTTSHYHINGPNLEQDAAPLISSSSNGPFARHDLHPIPTPYGFLHLTALYDSTLDVGGVLDQRARRLGVGHCTTIPPNVATADTMNGIGCGPGYVTGGGANCPSTAIPIQNHHAAVGGRIHTGGRDGGLQHHQQQRVASQPGRVVGDGRNTLSTDATNITTTRQVPNDVGLQTQRNTNNNNNSNGVSLVGNERVLSGLSLALMNLDQKKQGNQQHPQDQHTHHHQHHHQQGKAPLSPGSTQSKSIDGAASLRQRLAFHHPPPSFGNTATTTPSSSYGNNNNNNGNNTDITMADQCSTAYSAYHMHANHPQAAAQVGSLHGMCRSNSPGPSQYMLGMHSSPVSVGNTPPQPVFIGSLPRRGISTSVGSAPRFLHTDARGSEHRGGSDDANSSLNMSGTNGGISSPPFRNPVLLQLHPVQGSDVGSTTLGDDPLSSMMRARAGEFPSNMPHGTTTTNGNEKKREGAQDIQDKDVLLPPLTSLDMLANNPFKGLIGVGAGGGGNFNGSVVSSLSLGMGSTAYYGPNDDSVSNGGFTSLQSRSCLPTTGGNDLLLRSSGGNVSGGCGDHLYHSAKNESQEMYTYEDMPFAVDMECTNTSSGSDRCGGSGGDLMMGGSTPTNKMLKQNSSLEMGMGSSAGISASQVITSLAHRCATAGRLNLFSEEESAAKMTRKSTDAAAVTGIVKTTNGCGNLTHDGSLGQGGEGTSILAIGMVPDESVASLESKLAEFHTFEDSLLVGGIMEPLPSGGGGGKSSTLRQGSVAAPCVESS